MLRTFGFGALGALLISATGLAQTTPAPEPGSPGVYRDGEGRAAAIAAAVKTNPTIAVGPILNTDRYMIVEARRTGAMPPASHPGWTELHYITEGSAVMITGGRIVTGVGGAPDTIEGGVSQAVKKGDAVIVPPGSPHQYSKVFGSVTTLEVRFPDPTLVPKL